MGAGTCLRRRSSGRRSLRQSGGKERPVENVGAGEVEDRKDEPTGARRR
ncbi:MULTISPECIES: hypothetical protein [unclassified Streptomyces]